MKYPELTVYFYFENLEIFDPLFIALTFFFFNRICGFYIFKKMTIQI